MLGRAVRVICVAEMLKWFEKRCRERVFLWWVKDVLKKRDRIIKKLKTRKVWQEEMKFGLELPRTVEEALEIDRKTGTDFWRKAIEKEMATVMVAFMFMSDDWDPKTGPDGVFQFVKCHMVFDIKMDLTRKARFVAVLHARRDSWQGAT
jgi:hypothetical protein